MMLIASTATAQVDGAVRVNPEDRDVDLDDPTFVPMVRVGKVLQGRDSIQYVELNNIYIGQSLVKVVSYIQDVQTKSHSKHEL